MSSVSVKSERIGKQVCQAPTERSLLKRATYLSWTEIYIYIDFSAHTIMDKSGRAALSGTCVLQSPPPVPPNL